jgi:hypothetical protein
LSHGACTYIRMYINVVVNSVMLYLQHYFYNITFKIKQIIHSLRVRPPPRHLLGTATGLRKVDHISELVCKFKNKC